MVLSELFTVLSDIDRALNVIYVSYKTNSDQMYLSAVRRFNHCCSAPTLLKEQDKLVGIFCCTDGRYCVCMCFADRTVEPARTNDALIL